MGNMASISRYNRNLCTVIGIPESISEDNLKQLGRFAIPMYDKTSELTEVNFARKALFAKGRQIDHIPPTEASLIEHTKELHNKHDIFGARH